MLGPSRIHMAVPAVGMTSLVLGVIGLLLFFLPILGIPLSLCGALFGLMGVGVSITMGGAYLRWSLAGLALSCLALAINVAIDQAPAGYLRDRTVPRPWQVVADPIFTPPPASLE